MNIYSTRFFAVCPANGARIDYSLTIHTGQMLKVEDILAFVGQLSAGYHEDLADKLAAEFGGQQRLKAEHHGVQIETIRPHAAHWARAE